jgi:ribonuclease G
MENELIIDTKSASEDIRIALLGDKKLIELHNEKAETQFSVGDIYIGKVKRIAQGLNAAFVSIGHEKDAFLHYLDLGPQYLSLNKFTKDTIKGKQHHSTLTSFKLEQDIPKDGKINELLKQEQHILVQVVKEPISTKGPRLTSEITLAGRFLVLVPFSDRISISKNIKSAEERERLKNLMLSIKPKNFGVIVRTVAQEIKVAELDSDLTSLVSRWRKMHNELKTAQPPFRVLSELNRSSAILRDLLNESFKKINVDSEEMAEELRTYLHQIAPDKEKIVNLYKGNVPIFQTLGIEKQIKGSFGKHVTMKSGAYLVIEHTEAMHVVDVNSGATAKSKDDQETNALRVNLESAEEVARQLRLRDIGGIIVVDFIDLQKSENRKLLHEKMKEFMKDDKAKHNCLAPSRFGVVEITRQRVRPQVTIKTTEACPSCNGTGEIQASILIIEELENKLKALIDAKKEVASLSVHPFVDAYLKKGYPSMQMKWFVKHKRRLKIRSLTSYNLMDYKFFDAAEKELKA